MAPLYQAHNTMSEHGTDIAIYTLYVASANELRAISTACEENTAKSRHSGDAEYMLPAPPPQHTNVDAVVQHHRALNEAGK